MTTPAGKHRPELPRVETRPFKGHFHGHADCHWFRTTDVGDYRISSIGEYRPGGLANPVLAFDLAGNAYETMVFRLCGIAGCDELGARHVASWTNIAGKRYADAVAAHVGHEKMVKRFYEKAKAEMNGRLPDLPPLLPEQETP